MGFGHEKLDVYRAMLTKLGQRGYCVREDPVEYATGLDTDTDADPDPEREP